MSCSMFERSRYNRLESLQFGPRAINHINIEQLIFTPYHAKKWNDGFSHGQV